MTTKTWARLGLAGVLVLAGAAFFLLDLGRFLTLASVKASLAWLTELRQARPVLTALGFGLAYVAVTGLSAPGAVPLSLAGGALFGFWPALALVSFASTLGATLACAASRFILRDWVQARLGDRLAAVNRGLTEEGAFYLFSLRLIPVFPFSVINLVMGLTPLKLRTFYWVSQAGMLPGTAVFVNAGGELGRLESTSGLLSPSLLVSLALLGLFPLAVKKILSWYKERRRGRVRL